VTFIAGFVASGICTVNYYKDAGDEDVWSKGV